LIVSFLISVVLLKLVESHYPLIGTLSAWWDENSVGGNQNSSSSSQTAAAQINETSAAVEHITTALENMHSSQNPDSQVS